MVHVWCFLSTLFHWCFVLLVFELMNVSLVWAEGLVLWWVLYFSLGDWSLGWTQVSCYCVGGDPILFARFRNSSLGMPCPHSIAFGSG